MQTEMIQLGELLKKRRESRGISLKEVENATSIRHNYLEDIEKGHFGKLISPVYAQGFIKKYAAFLELDGEKLLGEYPYVMKILSETCRVEEGVSFLGSMEVRGSPGGEVKWLPNVVWVTLSVLVILAGWFLARRFGLF
ncbi:MAG: helix-turn-helix domain-containing protein [Chlamydiales bacterium]